MKQFFNYLILILLLVSCVEEKTQSDFDFIVFGRNQIKEIDRIAFNNGDFIDSCVFVPLETSEPGLIGEITQLDFFEDKYYIYDKQAIQLKVFNHLGNFLYDIGKRGQGSGEYLSINVFVINTKERKICLFDPMKKAVHEYSLEGKFLRSIAHQNPECSFFKKAVYAGDDIYCYSSINWGYNTTFSVLSSKDYSLKERFCPYPVKPNQQMSVEVMVYPFSLVDGKFHYVSLFSDTIYSYEKGRKTPYLLIETGIPNIPLSYLKDRNIENDPSKAYYEVWRDRKYSSGFTELGETDRFILSAFILGESDENGVVVKRPFYFLDKQTNTGFHVRTSVIPDLWMPHLVRDNKLMQVWNQNDIEAYMNNIKEEDVECSEIVKTLLKGYDPEYHNPIIIVYYMKY